MKKAAKLLLLAILFCPVPVFVTGCAESNDKTANITGAPEKELTPEEYAQKRKEEYERSKAGTGSAYPGSTKK